MDFLTIDPTFTQDCTVYNVSPLFIALGSLVIVFAGLLLGYSLAKSPVVALMDGYKKQRQVPRGFRSKIILVLQIVRLWQPLSMIAVLLFFAIIFVLNGLNIVISLIKSGCI